MHALSWAHAGACLWGAAGSCHTPLERSIFRIKHDSKGYVCACVSVCGCVYSCAVAWVRVCTGDRSSVRHRTGFATVPGLGVAPATSVPGDWRRPCHTCTGTEPTLTQMRRDWPHRCHTCTDRNAATSAPGLCFEWPCLPRIFRPLTFRERFVPVHVTHAFRRNINNQHAFWSVVQTVVDLYRCHDGTATVLRFDWDGRPTILIGPSL